MKVICNFNDPFKLPKEYPNNFDYGLEVGKEYYVMGIVLYKEDNSLYYLVDDNGIPNWFPHQIFTITENSLPNDWFMKIKDSHDQTDMSTLWGFNELCNHEEYYDALVDRDRNALNVYYRHKHLYEK